MVARWWGGGEEIGVVIKGQQEYPSALELCVLFTVVLDTWSYTDDEIV